jgi:hypothetical protein
VLWQRIIIDSFKIVFDDPHGKVNTLFGAYRTLKVQIDNDRGATSDQLQTR